MTVTGTSPVFIVGASRSGTTLMRSIANNHPDVWVSGESHYFDDLRVRMKDVVASPLNDEKRRICEDYFLALDHRPYGHQGVAEHSKLSRAELRTVAKERGDGADAYFEAFCIVQARREGKTIWGEKTPRHVFRIPEILARYPNARVICMVRDARAVVASYRDWRNQGGFDLEADPTHAEALKADEVRARKSYNIVMMSLLWRSTVQAARQAEARFGQERVRIQQYESLVEDAEGTVRSICMWAGMRFSPSMLEVPVHNSSVTRFREKAGVTREALDRWRRRLSPQEVGIIQKSAGRMMDAVGYVAEPVSVSSPRYALEWLKLPFAVMRASSANRGRIANLPAYVWRRLSLALWRV